MKVSPIKTRRVSVGALDLVALLEESLGDFSDRAVLAVTSKVVSLCEGSVVPRDGTDKETLIVQESDLYLPGTLSKYGHHFTITDGTLIPAAGIDESNGDGQYVLWPRDPQRTASDIRSYLVDRFGLKHVGVIITDSTCQPLRRGTTGIALAHSGFNAVADYVGTPDLFDRPFGVSQANICGGLAAAAVLVMGEGTEQTPLCVLSELPFVQFHDRDPGPEELPAIPLEDDLFAPFLNSVTWLRGGRDATR